MLAFEPSHEVGVALVATVVGDVGLLTLDLSHMPDGVTVAGRLRLLQGDINEAPTQQHRRQRMLALERRCSRIEQLVEIAVDLGDAIVDDAVTVVGDATKVSCQ